MQAVKSPQMGTCERIVVVTATGKRYDLGKPDSIFFRLRVFIYRIKRWLRG